VAQLFSLGGAVTMEVLNILLWLLVGGLCLLAVCGVLFFALGIIANAWPIIIGLAVGIPLWKAGHDNIGVLVIIVGIVGQIIWYFGFLYEGEGSSDDSMADKKRRYNKEGEIIGYEDKD
jgi:hypothetical protein